MMRRFWRHHIGTALALAIIAATPHVVFAACASPTANAGSMNWNGTAFQYCDGTTWESFGGAPGGSTGHLQYNNAGSLAGAAALTYATSGSLLSVTAQAATDKPLIVKGAASQSGNLQEWQNSSGTALASVTSTGVFTGSGAGLTALNAANLSSGTIPDARFPATLPAASGANLTGLNASSLASGTVPTARLGSGTASSSTFLRGDGAWAVPAGSGSGVVTGTYTGNGAAFQAVSLGFRPKMVIVKAVNGTYNGMSVQVDGVPDAASNLSHFYQGVVSASSNSNTYGVRITNSGFDAVGSDNDSVMNNNGTKYYYVAFSSTDLSTSYWLESASNIYRPSGNVGIGVTSPASAFHVGSTATTGRNFQVRSDGRPVIRYDDNSLIQGLFLDNRGITAAEQGFAVNFGLAAGGAASNSAARISAVAESLFDSAVNNDAALAFSTVRDNTLAERVRITSDGRVGIGTTTPLESLEIKYSQNSDVYLSLMGSRGSAAEIVSGIKLKNNNWYANQTFAQIDARTTNPFVHGASDLVFSTNPGSSPNLTERMRVAANGNVGIGTTSPSTSLHVVNQVRIEGATAFRPGIDLTTGTANTGMQVLRDTSLTDFWAVKTITTGHSLGLFTENDPLKGIYIKAGGNVGIGTASPAFKLDVYNSIAADAASNGQASLYLASAGSAIGAVYKPSGSSDTRVWVSNPGDVMTFKNDGSGNVGIGTTSPAAKLHIDGDMLLAATLPRIASASYLTLQSGAGQAMTFNTGGASERMRITSTGSVGIGTASPSATLHVVGSAYIAGGRSNLNSQANSGASARNFGPMLWIDNLFGAELGYNGALWTNRIFTRDSDGAIEFGKYPTGSTTNVNSFSPWMTIDNNGNVGIGTTTPGTKLHVANGAIRLDNSQSLTWTGTGGWDGTTAGTQIFKYSDNNLYFDTYDGAHVFRRASAAESMRITSSGNVGIGTTAPGQKLTVAGTIESTSGGVKFPDGTTQTTAFGKTMTIRTNVSTFTLANGESTGRTAYCNAGELATGGGCQDSGYKDFYIFRPESGGYSCFWYNTSGTSRTYTNAAVYVNCLK